MVRVTGVLSKYKSQVISPIIDYPPLAPPKNSPPSPKWKHLPPLPPLRRRPCATAVRLEAHCYTANRMLLVRMQCRHETLMVGDM